MAPTRQTEEKVVDLLEERGWGMIRRDRPGPRAAGGVAIFYNNAKIQMTRIKFQMSEVEVIAAIGRRKGQHKKVLVAGIW